MKTIKGRRFSRPVRRAMPRRSIPSPRSANGLRRSATRVCRSRPGTRACSISTRRRTRRPIATRSAARRRVTVSRSPNSSTHLQGQLVAVHPAYDVLPSTASPLPRCAAIRRRAPNGRSTRSSARCRPRSISASRRMRPSRAPWHGRIVYPWPQRPAGLVEAAFDELGAPLDAAARLCRRARRRPLLRDSSGRRPA